jgi:hypothetical protein
MASYLPPTEDLPVFDNSVFTSNSTTALTYTTAKKYFITYPIAQGTSTISDLIVGGISYLTPASGSFFNIGTNQVSGGTVRIGPTGGSAGVSVHCGNLDFKNNTMNNASSGTTGTITIGDLQTSGILNIGTGSKTTAGTINIGTGSGATANPVIIGGAGTVTTFTNGLTQASGKYITTSHTGTVTAPTSSQVGGVVTGSDITSPVPVFPSSGNITSWASITLPAGTWVITGTRRYDSSANSTRILWSFGTNLRNNAASPSDTDNTYGVTSVVLNSTNNFVTLTGTGSFTTDTIVYFNIYAQYTVAPSISTTNSSLRAIRIA